MSIFEMIINTLKPLNIPVAMTESIDKQLKKYIVMKPVQEDFIAYADNKPNMEVVQAELSLYSKENFIDLAREITNTLIEAGFTIKNRKYMDYNQETKLHHYVIYVAMEFCY